MNQKSLTLVEIIISMVILSLVISGITGIFIAGKRYLKRAEFKQVALNFAREKLEELEAFDFDDSNLQAGTDSDTLPNGWVRTWVIVDEDLDADTRPDRKDITVTVQWSEP